MLVAQIRRKSDLIGRVLPTGVNSRSCSTRSSLACSAAGISPISSSSSEPPSASSMTPGRSASAPVNDPRL